ncbi:hypothetical protein BBP40_008874 [Aspergillus hancockii]|nr:hypothetical protein BBP40_008874 [Aspergillus hancockii]
MWRIQLCQHGLKARFGSLEATSLIKPARETVPRLAPFSPQFRPQIITQAEIILNLMTTLTARVWLDLITLLDQATRNCFRGAEAAAVFRIFDPLAQSIARMAIDQGIPSRSPEHYTEMAHSLNDLMNTDDTRDLEEEELGYRKTLSINRTAVEGLLSIHLQVQKSHHDTVLRFGRYPHRNEALYRVPTPEEEEFLSTGSGFS